MIFVLEGAELDTELFELRREGSAQNVEPRVFNLLRFLVSNHERVVSKEEIVDEIWDGRIVTEATISTCMKAARQALGDDGRTQRMIRTVHGRGFRFIGAVAAKAEEPALAPEVSAPPAPMSADPPRAAAPEPRPAPRKKPVIAVLPFDNLSGDLDEYFADGVTEDIITNLSRFREVLVVGRTSTFRYKGQAIDLVGVCEELGATYIVEGSVRRGGNRVRITAQLIDGVSGLHVWADAYDRGMEDIFAVQDEVTRTIAARLGVSIQDSGLQKAIKKNPSELDAYDCVLKARRFSALLRPDVHAEARALLERAIKLDPDNADAAALLANIYLAEHRLQHNPQADPIARAEAMAKRAIELDPQHAYARCWLAMVHFFRRENQAFEAEAKRAIDLNPNDPDILSYVGLYLVCMGEFERGIAYSRRAQELNPLHPGWYHFSFARYHYHHEDYDEVVSRIERVGMPNFFWPQVLVTAALGQLEHPNAGQSLARIYELKPDFSAIYEFTKWNTEARDFEHLMKGLRKAGLEEEGEIPV